MDHAFTIADLRVPRGTKGTGWLPVARAPSGGSVAIPLVVLHGAEDGPVVVVDAAMHGEEHEGVVALLQLLRETDPATMRGTLIGVPVLNGPAFDAIARGNPLEFHYYDLNRAFPGDARGSITQRLAAAYFENVVRRANLHVSLHGGGAVYYLEGYVVAHGVKGGDALDLVKALGWQRVADAPDPGMTPYLGAISDKCHAIGIPSVTVEMGGASHRTPEAFGRTQAEFLRGLRNILIHYGMVDGTPDLPQRLWRIKRANLKIDHGGIIELAPGIDVDVPVEHGQTILDVRDPLGELVASCQAPFAGRILGLPASRLAYPGRIVAAVYDVIGTIEYP